MNCQSFVLKIVFKKTLPKITNHKSANKSKLRMKTVVENEEKSLDDQVQHTVFIGIHIRSKKSFTPKLGPVPGTKRGRGPSKWCICELALLMALLGENECCKLISKWSAIVFTSKKFWFPVPDQINVSIIRRFQCRLLCQEEIYLVR